MLMSSWVAITARLAWTCVKDEEILVRSDIACSSSSRKRGFVERDLKGGRGNW